MLTEGASQSLVEAATEIGRIQERYRWLDAVGALLTSVDLSPNQTDVLYTLLGRLEANRGEERRRDRREALLHPPGRGLQP